MKLILGAINGNYLRDITLENPKKVEEVVAAVAYATDSSLLFEWCESNKIPLTFYGRLDEDVAVSRPVMRWFLDRRSPNYVCRLVQHHHAKVIWWRGLGIYIGSANLTGKAWSENVEAGCYFEEEEISDLMAAEINDMFRKLDENSAPLTEELFAVMRHRDHLKEKVKVSAGTFWDEPSIVKWPGLITTTREASPDARKAAFLKEWHSTLQQIRDIGFIISQPENRPSWVPSDTPTGAQADQFLHAHYYQRTFSDGRADYLKHYEKNKSSKDVALKDTIRWWSSLSTAPNSEDAMLTIHSPFLKQSLSADALETMTLGDFEKVCNHVHSIRDYSRRVNNASVNLFEKRRYSIEEKVAALSSRIWNARSGNGSRVTQQLLYVLYGGTSDELPSRLWNAISDPKWKIEGLGISALGELVGWALPEKFPPRNGRTSKALKSLGYEVTIHV